MRMVVAILTHCLYDKPVLLCALYLNAHPLNPHNHFYYVSSENCARQTIASNAQRRQRMVLFFHYTDGTVTVVVVVYCPVSL